MVTPQVAGVGTATAVIVGAGPAGDAVAAGLRDGGWGGGITLIGDEPHAPYERPHLSKGYLAGTFAAEKLPLRPALQYANLGVALSLGERVIDFALDRRVVITDRGRSVPWDRLCIATGSSAVRLPGLEDAIYLRNRAHADALRAVIGRQTQLRIVGAGFIGCEVAAVAVEKGRAVTVFEKLEQPMVRVVGRELGAYIAGVHRARGVDLRLNSTSQEADLVAVGSAPRDVGVPDSDHGIPVDEFGRTSVPDVFAAGDVTRFYHPLFERRIRVEHFQTSQRQGFAVGRAMAGALEPYVEVPWFWSDQYDLNLQYAGAGLPWTETVVRGDFGRPPFTLFYLAGGQPVGALGVNDHHTVARARHAMQRRARLTPGQLEDPSFDLRRA